MKNVELNDKLIEAAELPVGKDQYLIMDSNLKGFGVRVTENGAKSFIIRYRNAEGRQRSKTLFPCDTISTDKARRYARVELAEVCKGIDVLQQKIDKRNAMRVSELASEYIESYSEKYNKASTVKINKSYFKRIILPELGNRTVESITKKDINNLHTKLAKTPYQANRVLALLRKMFSFAEESEYRPLNSNPCAYVEKYKEYARERYLSAEEMLRLDKLLTKYEDKYYSAVTAIRLLLMTGCRKGEILTLKWEYIKDQLKLLALPDSKTGAKNVPVSDAVINSLEETLRVNEYVCFGKKENACLVGLQKIWERFRAEIGLEDVRIHDLRHSFASSAISNGISMEYLSKLLGHANQRTTERYAHLTLEPLHDAANKIAESITTASKTGKSLRRVK